MGNYCHLFSVLNSQLSCVFLLFSWYQLKVASQTLFHSVLRAPPQQMEGLHHFSKFCLFDNV